MISTKAYSTELLTEAAVRLVRRMAQHFDDCRDGPRSTLPWRNPEDLKRLATEAIRHGETHGAELGDPARTAEHIDSLAKLYLDTSQRLHSPGYVGHQVPPPPPIAGLFEAIGAATNQPSGIYEMGPLPSVVERALMERMAEYLGWKGAAFDGFATHGGSVANLTALLAARNSSVPDAWSKGLADAGARLVILASEDAHYSVARAAGIMGLGADAVRKVKVDSRRRMIPEELRAEVRRSVAAGERPFCVVGSACSTPIGAFDPLPEIAAIAQEQGLWFHVDAAHGGGLLLSRKHRELLRGIELADSVVWDAHKMMFVPALCTFVFFRDGRKSYQAFDQDAPYLFDKDSNPTRDFDSAVRTIECTKRPVAMALWMLWSTFGPGLFEELVDRSLERTREFHDVLSRAPDFEALHEPECNILCFRYKPAGDAQFALRARLIRDGRFYITQARVAGREALRVTILNPDVERRHLEELLEEVRKTATARPTA
jgi:L-2,4-diaminobutyrate decarboxylase